MPTAEERARYGSENRKRLALRILDRGKKVSGNCQQDDE